MIEAVILGKDFKLSEDEFKFVTQMLGEPTRELSNCCDIEIEEPVTNHTARCPRCYEGCKVIYVWDNEKI